MIVKSDIKQTIAPLPKPFPVVGRQKTVLIFLG
jgi:hypothetical protein